MITHFIVRVGNWKLENWHVYRYRKHIAVRNIDRRLCEEFRDYITFTSSDLCDDEIVGACEERGLRPSINDRQLEQIWLAFRGKDCPQCLSDYFWDTLGKAI